MSARTSARSEIAQTIDAFFRAVNEHDLDALDAVFDPGCTFIDPFSPGGYTVETYKAVSAEYQEHFPDVEWRLLYRLIEDDGACCVYRCVGTGRGEWPPGNRIEGELHELTEVLVAKVEGGRITKLEFHIDAAEMAEQPWSSTRTRGGGAPLR